MVRKNTLLIYKLGALKNPNNSLEERLLPWRFNVRILEIFMEAYVKFVRLILMQFNAFVWMRFFGLILPAFWLLLDIFTNKEISKLLHEFWVGWAVMTLALWIVDMFYCWAIKKQKGTSEFTPYSDDFPLWKKIIHFSTIGKYSKLYE